MTGRHYVYRAKVGRDACVRQETRSFLSRVFDGAVAPAVVHFIEQSRLSPEELRQLRQLLDDAGKEGGSIMILPHAYAMLHWLTRATIEGSIIGGLILIAQYLLRHRISARWRYNLWLLVLLRLVLPAFPGNRYSPFNLIPWREQAESVPAVRIAQPAALPIPMPSAQPRRITPPDLLTELARGQKSPEELERDLNAHDARLDQAIGPAAISVQTPSEEDVTDAERTIPSTPGVSPTRESKGLSAASATPVSINPWSNLRGKFRAIRASWVMITFAGWLAVAALLTIRALILSVRLRFTIRAMPTLEDDALLNTLRRCCSEAAVSMPPELREAPGGFGPRARGTGVPDPLAPQRGQHNAGWQ